MTPAQFVSEVRWQWGLLCDWIETSSPLLYRIAVALALPTVIPACIMVGAVAGLAGGIMTTVHGVRAFIAGKPV
jgi:hypothetical protein